METEKERKSNCVASHIENKVIQKRQRKREMQSFLCTLQCLYALPPLSRMCTASRYGHRGHGMRTRRYLSQHKTASLSYQRHFSRGGFVTPLRPGNLGGLQSLRFLRWFGDKTMSFLHTADVRVQPLQRQSIRCTLMEVKQRLNVLFKYLLTL